MLNLKNGGWLLLLALITGCGDTGTTLSVSRIYNLDPQAVYLRTNGDTPQAPTIIDLLEFGAFAGTELRLESNGNYITNSSNGLSSSAGAVFSSSDELLTSSMLNRIPGAINAGDDVDSENTTVGDLPTNINQDFAITGSGVTVVVPSGAKFLFLGVIDPFVGDNSASGSGFSIEVSY